MQYQIPSLQWKQIHQGSTVQTTSPIPPVSNPELSYLSLQQNRYIVQVTPQLHQGATVQATHPTPTVSQPLVNYFVRRFQPNLATLIHQAPVVVSTDYLRPSGVMIYGLGFYEESAYLSDGPTIDQNSYIFPLLQPRIVPYRLQLPASIFIQQVPAVVSTDFLKSGGSLIYGIGFYEEAGYLSDGPMIQETYIFPLLQPRRSDFIWDENIYCPPLTKLIIEIGTIIVIIVEDHIIAVGTIFGFRSPEPNVGGL